MIKAQLNQTAAIVRTFNFPGIGDFVQNLLNFGIRHVVVVVSYDQDNGVTAPLLRPFNPSRVHLVERSFKHGGRAWSAMLNTGLMRIRQGFEDDFVDYILPASNTVQLEPNHLECLYSALESQLSAMVAGARFQGIGRDGEEVSLGTAYNDHYRNTLALYRAEAFRLHRLLEGFDEASDGLGGMEDLTYKLMLEGLTSYRVVENVVKVPLAVYTHRTPEQQAKYETDMEQGIVAAKERARHLMYLDGQAMGWR